MGAIGFKQILHACNPAPFLRRLATRLPASALTHPATPDKTPEWPPRSWTEEFGSGQTARLPRWQLFSTRRIF